MTPHVRRSVDWLVGLSSFPKTAGINTPLLLSEHLLEVGWSVGRLDGRSVGLFPKNKAYIYSYLLIRALDFLLQSS